MAGDGADKPTAKRPGGRQLKAGTPEEVKATFLRTLARFGNVSRACKAARINRDTAYAWRKVDRAYALAWDRALEDAVEVLEQVAWKRAVRGTKKPVYQGGQHVGDIQEYSDTLLIFLLKGAAPKKYRDHQQIEHTGALPISINITKKPPKATPDGGDAGEKAAGA